MKNVPSNKFSKRSWIWPWKLGFSTFAKPKILGFEVDSYVDIEPTKLPFSLDDLWYIRNCFQVFSTVSLFGLIETETKRIEWRLHSSLDTWNAKIAFQCQVYKVAQSTTTKPVKSLTDKKAFLDFVVDNTGVEPKVSNTPKVNPLDDLAILDAIDTLATSISNEEFDYDKDMGFGTKDDSVEKEQDAVIGPSVLDNVEINIVHVLPLEFQSACQ